jgi:shikimate dehydrogenase
MVGAHVTAPNLQDAIRGFRALKFKGLSVTMPHKVTISKLLDQLEPTASEIGAVNTVVFEGERLVGYNTDWLGIVQPLERLTSLRGKRVALIGAGGAAQAALFATTRRGAKVTVFNRTASKGQALAKAWKCSSRSLDAVDEIASSEIIINCTSVGMGAQEGDSAVPLGIIEKHHIIFETIYSPYTTALAGAAEERGAAVIRGSEMFLEQALAQFELHTGQKAPRDDMERALRQSIEG